LPDEIVQQLKGKEKNRDVLLALSKNINVLDRKSFYALTDTPIDPRSAAQSLLNGEHPFDENYEFIDFTSILKLKKNKTMEPAVVEALSQLLKTGAVMLEDLCREVSSKVHLFRVLDASDKPPIDILGKLTRASVKNACLELMV
jgi:hypothetical protein